MQSGDISSAEMASVLKGPSAIEKLPDELIASILAPHLRLNNSYQLRLNNSCQLRIRKGCAVMVCSDVKRIISQAIAGFRYAELTRLYWFQDTVWFKVVLLAPEQRIASLNTAPLQVSRQFANIGMHLLRSTNGFISVTTASTTFKDDASSFGLQLWQLDQDSYHPDVAVKISINSHHSSKDTPQEQRSIRQFLLDLNEIENFGIFLMVQAAKGRNEYEGWFLCISVCTDAVPGFCRPGDAFEKLLLGPFVAGLSEHIKGIEISEDVLSRSKLIDRLRHHKQRVMRFSGHPNVDFFGPTIYLDRLICQYQQFTEDKPAEKAEVLRRMIQFAIAALRSKLGHLGRIANISTGHFPQVRFILDVLRISAYRMAQNQLELAAIAPKAGNGNWKDHALNALHCFGYALAFPPLNFTSNHVLGWKAQCYIELFMVYILLDMTRDALKCVECFGMLTVERDPNKSQEQLASEEAYAADGWWVAAFAAKKAYIREAIGGHVRWEKNRSFRMKFASKFEADELGPKHRRNWPTLQSSQPLAFPDFARIIQRGRPH